MGPAEQYPWLWAAAPGALVAAALVIRRLRLARVVVEGRSMIPALEAGDRLVVMRRRRYRSGQVVAVHDPRRPWRVLVKRVAVVRAGGYLELRGDNPGASTDSRTFGDVGPHLVLGQAFWRYGPPERTGPVPGADRRNGTLALWIRPASTACSTRPTRAT
jgi:nickel-type superoxide dismutase maturation protease